MKPFNRPYTISVHFTHTHAHTHTRCQARLRCTQSVMYINTVKQFLTITEENLGILKKKRIYCYLKKNLEIFLISPKASFTF